MVVVTIALAPGTRIPALAAAPDGPAGLAEKGTVAVPMRREPAEDGGEEKKLA
jgi:hypothetical protein